MAALYPDPFARFIIAPNKPNNGGKVFFFENGTTTLKQTFSDTALLIPNTNPLILNANGNFQVQVFANDSDIYSVEVKDFNDVVTQPTIDNVNFLSEFALSSADVIAALAANVGPVDLAGASMIGSAFAAFADNLDLTSAGSIDASTGAIILGTVTGTTAINGDLAVNGTGSISFITQRAADARIQVNVTGTSGSNIARYELRDEGIFRGSIRYSEADSQIQIFGSNGSFPGITINGTQDIDIPTGNLDISTGQLGIGVAAPSVTALTGIANVANTVLKVIQDSVTSRSINASGTINASGADYAEYIRLKNVLDKIAKGAIVGFDADGLIVTRFSEAVSFGVKSTDPAYVGGDKWSANVSERPTKPGLTPPKYTGSEQPELIKQPKKEDDQTQWLIYQEALIQYKADQKASKNIIQALQDEIDTVLMPQYLLDLKAWEDELEAARQTVDRIAFCGVVPANDVIGNPGDFIIPIAGPDDTIIGKSIAKADMTLIHSLDRVGRIHKIGEDGRAIILVNMG